MRVPSNKVRSSGLRTSGDKVWVGGTSGCGKQNEERGWVVEGCGLGPQHKGSG